MTGIDQLLREAEVRLECVLSCLTFGSGDPEAIQLARVSLVRALADIRHAHARLEAPHRRASDADSDVVLDPADRTRRR